jgi:type I restriction enzyme R subunit
VKKRELENASLRQELEQLKASVAERKLQNVEVKDSHNYNEADTRHFIIDQYLKEMGWLLEDNRDREYRSQNASFQPKSAGKWFR